MGFYTPNVEPNSWYNGLWIQSRLSCAELLQCKGRAFRCPVQVT